MAKRTNIVDFDEAKAASRSRRARTAQDKGGRRTGGETAQARRRNATSSARPSRTASDVRGSGRSEREARRSAKGGRTSAADAVAASSRRAQKRVRDDAKSTPSNREQQRRNRSKARADKMFDRQYAADEAMRADAEQAPRAALYEGRVGSAQRKAARMQRSSEAGPVSAKVNPAGWFSNLNLPPRTVKLATAALCVVLACAFLYVPAQQYYQSVREHDRLEAEYAVISQRNEALDEQNDMLAGDAGMEEAVHEKYGYVVKGDQTAIVTGLSEHTTDTSRDGEDIEANVLSSAVKAPEEWYTPYLDAFFGVS